MISQNFSSLVEETWVATGSFALFHFYIIVGLLFLKPTQMSETLHCWRMCRKSSIPLDNYRPVNLTFKLEGRALASKSRKRPTRRAWDTARWIRDDSAVHLRIIYFLLALGLGPGETKALAARMPVISAPGSLWHKLEFKIYIMNRTTYYMKYNCTIES